jgi:DivIVA domain-containing protein
MDTSEEHRAAPETDQEPEDERPFADFRDYVPTELLNVSFPGAVRGYDRGAVDAYVKRVNRVIAEVKVSASPRAAVRHALRQTEQEVSGLLERARETADQVTTSAFREAETEADGIKAKAEATKAEAEKLLADSKAEADTLLAKAKAEAEDILVRSRLEAENTVTHAQGEADERLQQLQVELASLRDRTETRMREFQADTDAVWEQRRQLLEEMRGTASRLVDLADAATAREPDEPDLLEDLEPKGRAETKADPSSRDEADPKVAVVEAEEATDGVDRGAAETGGGRSKRAVKTKQQPS